MAKASDEDDIDWSLTTWEGSRREQLRRWSLLTLEDVLTAQEDLHERSQELDRTAYTDWRASWLKPVALPFDPAVVEAFEKWITALRDYSGAQ
jgi:hypothetical protein